MAHEDACMKLESVLATVMQNLAWADHRDAQVLPKPVWADHETATAMPKLLRTEALPPAGLLGHDAQEWGFGQLMSAEV